MPGTLVDLSDNLKVEVVSDEGSIGSSNVALTGGLSRTAVASADGTVELTAGGAPMPGGVGDELGPAIVGELAGAEGAAATARRGHGDESGPQPAAPSVTAAAVAIMAMPVLTENLDPNVMAMRPS